MNYIVRLNYYDTENGYSHSEIVDTGITDKVFEASDWAEKTGLDTETDTGWFEVEVEFYEDDDDPMFDSPTYTSILNDTIA